MDEVEIILQGSGLQYTGKVPLFQAVQILGVITRPNVVEQIPGDDIEVLQTGKQSPGADSGGERVTSSFESPKLAITTTEAKTNPQKIVALALFIGASSTNGVLFSRDEILAQFAKAGELKPKNIGRDFMKAVQAGYITEESEGKYRLLSSTDSVAQDGFKKLKPTRKTTSGGSNSASKTDKKERAGVREQITKLAIEAQMADHVGFFDLKVRSDQILWILAYAKLNGVDGLSRAELVHLSGKLGGSITPQSFTSSNTPNMKNGHIRLDGELIHLNAKGERHIKTVGSHESPAS